MVAPLPDGRVLIAGGAGAIPEGSPYSDTPTTAIAVLYEPKTDTWTDLPPMPEPREQGSAVSLHDGSVLLVGGSGGWDQEGERIGRTSAVRFVPSR
jgi:hypothetical protein